ncbi:MAG: ATP-binding protein [bacterium]|nr:ATP-binding protein [bacterium]
MASEILEGTSSLDLDHLPDVTPRALAPSQEGVQRATGIVQAIKEKRASQEHPELGLIRIRTMTTPTEPVIEVEDDRAGIPAMVPLHIFEPYYTTRDVGKGTGQGLAVTRNVVVENMEDVSTWRAKPRRDPSSGLFSLDTVDGPSPGDLR